MSMIEENTKSVGSYEVTSKLLGEGQFGKVYFGYDAEKRPVAIKALDRSKLQRTHQVKLSTSD
jgi:serine/threonine protein kinase